MQLEILTKKDLEPIDQRLAKIETLLRQKETEKIEARPGKLLRLSEVLEKIPVCKTTWWEGVRKGKYPTPVSLGSNTKAWREADIERLVQEGIPEEE